MASRRLHSALLAALISGVGVAHAEPLGSHQPHIEASLGARVSKVRDAGYDPFATSDELAQLSLGVAGTVVASGRLSLAAGGFWDYGGHSSAVRGEATSLTAQRLSVGPELRYHVITPLFVFVHALPAFAYTEASLNDSVAAATRYARHWSYGLDGSVGAAYELYAMPSGESIRPRLWATAEAGYGYLSSTRLSLRPDAGSGPQRTAAVDLGSLSLSGPFVRVSVALSL